MRILGRSPTNKKVHIVELSDEELAIFQNENSEVPADTQDVQDAQNDITESNILHLEVRTALQNSILDRYTRGEIDFAEMENLFKELK